MKNKICMITGATSGIGKQTAFGLAEKGASVVIVGRNSEKCISTVEKIKKSTGNDSIEYLLADLSSQQEIHKLVEVFKSKYELLHILINNAGARFMTRQETPDKVEMTFALNHLAYFLLTNLLIDVLKKSSPARIINLSSGNYSNDFDFEKIDDKNNFDGRTAYAQSKLANQLFTYELSKILNANDITVNAVDPGGVATNFNKNNGWKYWTRHMIAHILSRDIKSPKQGACTSIYLATSPEVDGITGRFFRNEKPIRSSQLTFKREISKKLWYISEKLTGLKV